MYRVPRSVGNLAAVPTTTPATIKPVATTQPKYNPTFSYDDSNMLLQELNGGVTTPTYKNVDAVNKYKQDNGFQTMEYENNGNPYTISGRDPSKPLFADPKLDAFFKKVGGATAVKTGADGMPDRSLLSNQSAVFYDPTFGWVTPSNNYKPRTQETTMGKVVSTAIPAIAGLMMPGVAAPYWAAMNAGMKFAGGGSWKNMIPTLAGLGLGAMGVPSNLTGLAKAGIGLAINNPFRRP